jgi:hypothetical protein
VEDYACTTRQRRADGRRCTTATTTQPTNRRATESSYGDVEENVESMPLAAANEAKLRGDDGVRTRLTRSHFERRSFIQTYQSRESWIETRHEREESEGDKEEEAATIIQRAIERGVHCHCNS